MEDQYTLDDLTDDGAFPPEPSSDYVERLDLLDNVVRECIFVSRRYAGIPSPTGKHFYASVLFTALLTRATSMLILAPHTPWAAKKIEHWDYASLTGIVRTIIELRIAFFYLCIESCEETEWDVRWNLFNLHDCVSRIRLFEAIGHDDEVLGFKDQAEMLRTRVRDNSFFQHLDPKRHKKLLHGQTAYLSPLEEIAERAGLDINTFRWLYIMFSSHVHGLPMSFYRIGGDYTERGRGLPSPTEEGYSCLCLSLASALLVSSRDELHLLFEGLTPEPVDDEVDTHVLVEEAIDKFRVGDQHEMDLTELVHVHFNRLEEDAIRCSFYLKEDNSLILELNESEERGRELSAFDPLFWKVDINGGPATNAMVQKILDGPHAFRFDFAERVLKFKVAQTN